MLLAIDKSGEKIKATPRMNAICPGCGGEVIARCGDIKIWHWAHKVGICRYDSEPETQWHLEMKDIALKMDMEIEKIFDPNQRFRADIYDPKKNMVTEVQHSPITEETIMARCKFYDSKEIKIRWIFDTIDRYKEKKLQIHSDGEIWQIYPPKYIYCLFDNGLPIYDTFFNFSYDYDKHTDETIKIEFMSNGSQGCGLYGFRNFWIKKGDGYGKFITNLFVNEEYKKINDNEKSILIKKLESEILTERQKREKEIMRMTKWKEEIRRDNIDEKKLKRIKIYGKK